MMMMMIMIIIIIVVILSSLATGHFSLVPVLNQRWSPPFRHQVSDYNTFLIMCDVPIIAVFCSESSECFPGMASKFFLYYYYYHHHHHPFIMAVALIPVPARQMRKYSVFSVSSVLTYGLVHQLQRCRWYSPCRWWQFFSKRIVCFEDFCFIWERV
jgi:hypothetical protein